MMRILTFGVLLVATALAGCGGGGGGGMTVNTPTPAARYETQFGSNFATDFQAGANTEPKDVASGDTIAVSLTAEPVALPST